MKLRYLMALAAMAMAVMPAFADAKPVALVTAYTGANPALNVYSEIMDGTDIVLGNDAVTFVHYQTCKTVEARGGRLKVSVQRFEAEGGAIRDLNQEQCPEEVTVKTAGVAGGVVLRAVGARVVPARLECVLTGDARFNYRAVQVFDGDDLVTEFPLSGAPVVMPRAAPSLTHEKLYRLVLLPKVATQASLTVRVAVSDEADRQVCLIRLE